MIKGAVYFLDFNYIKSPCFRLNNLAHLRSDIDMRNFFFKKNTPIIESPEDSQIQELLKKNNDKLVDEVLIESISEGFVTKS